MKGLLAGTVLIFVIGLAGFLYRNALEHPAASGGSTVPVACTQEAKLCPDGSSVGRTGPDCQFAACAFPNVELASAKLAFAVPDGYAQNGAAQGDPTLLAAFEKPAKEENATHAIVVRDYLIAAGKTATSTMLENTVFESSGVQATSTSQFAAKIANARTFYCVTLERFEGQVHTACYLPRTTDVLRFEVLEKDVDWTNPHLDIDALPEHQAFARMLATVQLR